MVEGDAELGHTVGDDGVGGSFDKELIDDIALVLWEGGDLAFWTSRLG